MYPINIYVFFNTAFLDSCHQSSERWNFFFLCWKNSPLQFPKGKKTFYTNHIAKCFPPSFILPCCVLHINIPEIKPNFLCEKLQTSRLWCSVFRGAFGLNLTQEIKRKLSSCLISLVLCLILNVQLRKAKIAYFPFSKHYDFTLFYNVSR